MPDIGTHPRVIANKLIRSNASQNSGAENPINANIVVDLSKKDPRLKLNPFGDSGFKPAGTDVIVVI